MHLFDIRSNHREDSIFPDESFLYNSKHLGERFYRQDSRWDALCDKPIRELTNEELAFGCSAVSTNGMAIYRLERKRRELLKLVSSLRDSLDHGQLTNNEMDFIKKGILEGFDSIYEAEDNKSKRTDDGFEY